MDEEGTQPPSPSSPEPTRMATTALQSHSAQPSGMSFLDLPPEIRNAIYRWLFPTGRSAVQLLARHSGGYISMSDRLALLLTCRQIYNEASSVLQCQRRFKIVQPKTIFEVLDVLDTRDMTTTFSLIRYIVPDMEIKMHYDLDHHIMNNDIPPIFHASPFREYSARDLRARITATISISGDLQELRKWVQSGRSTIGMDFETIHIILRFPQVDDKDVMHSCLQAAELISATSGLSRYTYVSAVIAGKDGSRTDDGQDLFFINASLLLFVHTILKKIPGGAMRQCPSIWINQNLEISHADLEHEDGTIECVLNKDAKRSLEAVERILYAGNLVRYYQQLQGPLPSHEYGSEAADETDCMADSDAKETLLGFAKNLADRLTMDLW